MILVMGVLGRECKVGWRSWWTGLLYFCVFVFLYFCQVGREERVEVVVASYSGEMEQLLRQAVRDGQHQRAVSLLLGEVRHTLIVLQISNWFFFDVIIIVV